MNNSYKKFRIVHRIPFNFSNGIKYYDERVAKIFAVSRFYKSRNRSLEPEDFGRGWILKEEAERTNKEFYGCVRVPTSRCSTKSLKKKKGGSKSWEACQKFDFPRGLKYLEDIVSVFVSVEILHFGDIFFFHYLISDKSFLKSRDQK